MNRGRSLRIRRVFRAGTWRRRLPFAPLLEAGELGSAGRVRGGAGRVGPRCAGAGAGGFTALPVIARVPGWRAGLHHLAV